MELFEKAKFSQSKRTRVKVCSVCGSRGFSNALICCSRCSETTVHQYCVGISPGSFVDICSWVCEYCLAVIEPESSTCHAFVSASNERSPERCIVHAGTLTIKSKSEIMVIPDQPEPRCVIYPATCKETSESEERRNCSRIDEDILSTASISLGDSMDYQEEIERPVSSFMEYPESIMYGLVFLVCPSGKITICRSTYFGDEFNSQNAGNSGFLNYGEESGVQVSSLMEYPEAISGEIVLLGKPAGEIIFHCGVCGVKSDDDSHFSCWKAAIHDIINSSNDINPINSDKLVKKLGSYSFTPDSLSRDEVIDRNGDLVEPDCVLNKETDVCSSDESYVFPTTDMQGDTVFEYVLDDSEDEDVDGYKFKHRKSRKKKPISSFYDYLQPISPECKRARRKRHKKPPSKGGGVKKSLARCDRIPPLKPDCRSTRSKRWKISS